MLEVRQKEKDIKMMFLKENGLTLLALVILLIIYFTDQKEILIGTIIISSIIIVIRVIGYFRNRKLEAK